MTDSVDRLSGISPRAAEKVAAVSPAAKPRERKEETEFSFEDRVEVHAPPAEQQALEEIDLSLSMIRALVNKELDADTMQALMEFAPLGDLTDAAWFCDAAEHRGIEFVTWRRTMTLVQALIRAASE